MTIPELNFPHFRHLKISPAAGGRYAGETGEVRSVSISYVDGRPTDCYFTVEVSSGAMIEVPAADVESAACARSQPGDVSSNP